MAIPFAALAGAGLGVFSALSAKKGQEDANRAEMEFNQMEAQKQRDFEERMFSTRFQTTRKDLEAAGINPLLMTGMNPTTPMGAAAQAHPKSTRSEMSAILSNTAKQVADAKQQFGALPHEVRNRFRNDPAVFLDFLASGTQADVFESIDLGLRNEVITKEIVGSFVITKRNGFEVSRVPVEAPPAP